MTLIRCKDHAITQGRKHTYVSHALPLGYPDSAVICGTKECNAPGLVWLNEEESALYQAGERTFNVNTQTLKIRVI